MKKYTLYILVILAIGALFKAGCSDINDATPSEGVDGIKSVIPARAPYGARIVISGRGFGEVQQVLFAGTSAPIDAASDTTILTKVPLDANSGPIEVITGSQTFTGPTFTVDSTKNLFLSIQNVTPQVVWIQDTVRISGSGFNTTPVANSDNPIASSGTKPGKSNKAYSREKKANGNSSSKGKIQLPAGRDIQPVESQVETKLKTVSADPAVYFNDVSASTIQVSDTLIIATVPDGAESGVISVIVEADTAIGPEMTVYRHSVSEISPASGTIGTEVKISGSHFKDTPVANEVAFAGTEATVIQANESEIITKVPEGASSGAVTVTINNRMVTGPDFTIESEAPVIDGINPEMGIVGTEVTITGSKFSSTESDNKVTFNGTEAPVIQASESELVVQVPEGATDGPVVVQVGDKSTTGPAFDVITTGSIQITTSTSGSELDPNGYLISFNGSEGERVAINDTLFQANMEPGTYEVHISDIESNCYRTGDFPNPRNIEVSAGETVDIEYNISCEGVNEPPVATFTSVCTNLSCNFDASESFDNDGTIESYEWNFGDDLTGSGQMISHTYESSGTYSVQLTVTDNEGATAIQTNEITLTVPQITELSPASGPVGTEVTIIGSGFSSTPSENTVGFTSGSTTINAPVKSASETELIVDVPGDVTTGPVYVTVNDYTVEGPTFTLEILGNLEVITSTSGSDLDTDGYQINVQGFDVQSAQVNDTLNYNDIDAGSYQVEISDVASNCQLSEDFPNPRTVDVNQNTTTTTTFNVFCSPLNEAPVATFTTSCTNLSCDFNAAESSDSDGTIVSYEWNFGDGLSDTGESISHSYEIGGTYTVQLTVTDDDGATDIVSNDVTVTLPEISGISPESGPTGTEVTITGNNFSNTTSENIVEFNGVRAELNGASQNELLAIVPSTATTGPVTVTIDDYTVSGPTFTVQEPKTLEVAIESEGTEIDSDGYTLTVTGQTNRSVGVNDNETYSDIYENNVDVELSGIANNCRVDGENPRNVNLDNSDNAGYTSFTVDCTVDIRGYIAYELTANGQVYSDIYLRNEDRTENDNITNTSNSSERDPAISPDGLSIVFTDGRYIYVMDSDGSDVRQIVEDGYNSSPSWSPDGEQIVFERFITSEIPDLYIMDKDGSNMQNITNTETIAERNPDWSPSGDAIVFSGNPDAETNIYTIQPDGSNQVELTSGSSVDNEPEWSPDEERIAFSRNVSGSGSKVYLMNSDGSSQAAMTPGSQSEYSPTWSPDGTKVAYVVSSDGVYQIYVYSISGSDIVHSYYTFDEDESPHWNYK